MYFAICIIIIRLITQTIMHGIVLIIVTCTLHSFRFEFCHDVMKICMNYINVWFTAVGFEGQHCYNSQLNANTTGNRQFY